MIALNNSLPNPELVDPDNEQIIAQLMHFVEEHIQRRDLLREDIHQKQNNFRNILVELERETVCLKRDNVSIRECNDQLRKTISTLEGRIYKLQNQIDNLIYKLNSAHEAMQNMQQELRYRDRQVKQCTTDKQKIIEKCNNMMQAEIDRITVELGTKLRKQREELERSIKKKDDKLKLMKQILTTRSEEVTRDISMATTVANTKIDNAEDTVTSTEGLCAISSKKSTVIAAESVPTTSKEKSCVITPVNSEISSKSAIADTTIGTSKARLETNTTKANKIPVVNPRYRRSQNADKWINHYPSGIVPTGTILQPEAASCKQTYVKKLTNPKTFATKSIKYCLYSQEQDTDGELETKLYKADVLPTSGGGAQIVFNDIECLKQVSPTKATRRNGQTSVESTSSRT